MKNSTETYNNGFIPKKVILKDNYNFYPTSKLYNLFNFIIVIVPSSIISISVSFLKDVINAVNIPVIKRRYFTPSSSEISNLSAHIVPIAVSLFFNTNGFTLLPPVL